MPLANFDRDLDQIHRDFPSRLDIGSRCYKVTSTEITQQISVDEAGFKIPQSFDVIGTLSDFGSLIPVARQTVTLDGKTCQVGDIETDKHTNTIRLFLHKS